MTEEEILEYNKRCAKFLGSELKNDGQHDYWTYDHLGFDPMKIKGSSWISGNFEFHSDWNWIMEVVDAIEKLGFNRRVDIDSSHVLIQYKDWYTLVQKEDKKEAVVQAINQFLIRYDG